MPDDEIIEALRSRIAAGRPTDSTHLGELRVASSADLDEVEADLGFMLPPLLRRVYLEVANGGVGPFVGIEGRPPDGYSSDGGDSEFTHYHSSQQGEWPADLPRIPPKVLLLCDYGCAMWALLDCRHPEGRM